MDMSNPYLERTISGDDSIPDRDEVSHAFSLGSSYFIYAFDGTRSGIPVNR